MTLMRHCPHLLCVEWLSMMSSAGYRGWRLSVFLRSLTHDAVVEGARRDGRLRRALRHGEENVGTCDDLVRHPLVVVVVAGTDDTPLPPS